MEGSEPLRVLQVCGSGGPGGAERFFLRLACALARQPGVSVLPVVRRNSWLAERLQEQGLEFRTAGFGGRLDLLTRPKLVRILRDFRPHVAQSWMNRASSFLPRGRVPTIGRLGGPYNLKYYRGLDWLVANTPALCDYLRTAGWPAARMRHIWNFVDLPPADYRTRRDDMRARFGLPPDAPVLLVAGRLHEVKGFDVAIRALAALAHTGCHLLVAGTGEQESALRELAAGLGVTARVHFAGWVNDISGASAAADLQLVPSRMEPLGNVVLEAWAHRLPVIASHTDGPRQLIHEGEDGVIVPIGDADALAAAIDRLLDDPAAGERLAARGHERLLQEFTEAAIVARYLALYREIAAPGAGWTQ